MKFSVKLSALLGFGLTALLAGTAQAAENLTLINGALNHSVTMDELELLVDEGVSKGQLHLALSKADIEPAAAREFLTQNINYDFPAADALFNSNEGEAFLSDISQIIMPRSTEEDAQQALRAAVVNSLRDDNRLSPMEIIANYPVDAQVDVAELNRRQATYVGLGEVVSMLKSTDAKSKAQITNETLAARFSNVEARRQDRMQAMWANADFAAPVAVESFQPVQPINGLW